MSELVEMLRDEAEALQNVAWSRTDGGHRCCLSAVLATEAADRIEQLEQLIHESLFHLRLDDAAKAYHNKAQAALRSRQSTGEK